MPTLAVIAALPTQTIDTTIPAGVPYWRLLGLVVLAVAFLIVAGALFLGKYQKSGDTAKAYASGKVSGMQIFLVILGLSTIALVTLGQGAVQDLLGI